MKPTLKLTIMKRWKPSKNQRNEFAEKMQNPEFAKTYYERKAAREAKKRATSLFDYESAGGMYLATEYQFDFCMKNYGNLTKEQKEAADMVMFSFNCKEKIHHDSIHIINELIRKSL